MQLNYSSFILLNTLVLCSSLSLDTLFCVSRLVSTEPCKAFRGALMSMCHDYMNNNEPTIHCSNFRTNVHEFTFFIFDKNKLYGTVEEITHRYNAFSDNLDYIDLENSKNHSYTLGQTVFADYTHDEYKQMVHSVFNSLPKDYCLNDKASATKPLTTVDWTAKGAVTRVKDQGQCGSCWAFSTVGALEGLNAIKTGILTEFSEQQLVDCASSYGNHGCNGGLMSRAFSYVIDNGLTTESNYPYTGKAGTCIVNEQSLKINGCRNVYSTEYDLSLKILSQPISVSIEADSRSFQLYKSGVYDDPQCGTELDHGVLAVGIGNMNGKDYYKVKNSWTSDWGDQGYIYLFRNSSSLSHSGQCGIAKDASYPV